MPFWDIMSELMWSSEVTYQCKSYCISPGHSWPKNQTQLLQLVLLPLANVQRSPGTREVYSCKLRVQKKNDKNVNLFVINAHILEKSNYLAPPLKNWSASEIPHPHCNSRTELFFFNLSFAILQLLFIPNWDLYIQFIQAAMNRFHNFCCKDKSYFSASSKYLD